MLALQATLHPSQHHVQPHADFSRLKKPRQAKWNTLSDAKVSRDKGLKQRREVSDF
jgi:hypothetical protein